MGVSTKSLTYAESVLGVHEVHHLAQTARAELDKVLTDMGIARDRKRDLEFRLSGSRAGDHRRGVRQAP